MSTNNHLQILIKKRLKGDFIVANQTGQAEEKILIRKNHLIQVMHFLAHDPDASLDLLLDISCLEHAGNEQICQWQSNFDKPHFEIFYLLRSSKLGYRLCLSILLDENEPSLPSLSSLYSSAVWLEREMWDMFGIYPEGHPNLARLIMYAGFAGHPMKRSYPITKEQALIPIYKHQHLPNFLKE